MLTFPRVLRTVCLIGASLSLTGCSEPALTWPNVQRVQAVPEVAKLRDPSWAPGGDLIAIATEDTSTQSSGRIYVVQIKPEQYRGYGERLTWNLEPHWSPDGSSLAYSQGCMGIDFLDGSNLGVALGPSGCGAVWSPDGLSLAVYAEPVTDTEPSSVRLVDARTGVMTSELFTSTLSPRYFGGLAWSKATNTIALSFGTRNRSLPGGSNEDIYLIDPDNKIVTTLVAASADQFDPSWSPDGRWLVFLSESWMVEADEDVSRAVTVMFAKADGSCLVPALAADDLTGVDWSPDGERLAITYRNQLYIVNIAETFGPAFADLDSLCGE